MTRLWTAWVDFWDRREAPTALALVRVLLGAMLLLDLLHVAWMGMITPLLARPPDGFAAPYDGWASALFGTGPEAAYTLWIVATVSAAWATCLGSAAGVTSRAPRPRYLPAKSNAPASATITSEMGSARGPAGVSTTPTVSSRPATKASANRGPPGSCAIASSAGPMSRVPRRW